MGSWLLIIAFFTGDGTAYLNGNSFATKDECEVALVKLPEMIRKANNDAATSKNDSIAQYAAACVQSQTAPKGKWI